MQAGTAVVGYDALFATDGLAIFASLVLSTLVAVLIGGAIAGRTSEILYAGSSALYRRLDPRRKRRPSRRLKTLAQPVVIAPFH